MNKTQIFAKNKLGWPEIRLILLGLTLVTILGVFLKLVLSPNKEEKKIYNPNATFPNTVPLSGWDLTKTVKLDRLKKDSPEKEVAPGQIYKYVNNKNSLEVEARYEKYDGSTNRYIINYRKLPPATIDPKIKYQKNIGSYGLFTYKDQAYLTACVNAVGESSVTNQQFSKNLYTHGWAIQRPFLWMIGQQDLLDARCVWTLMSVPITPFDPYNIILDKDLEDEYQKLETAWAQWYRWWKTNFPSY